MFSIAFLYKYVNLKNSVFMQKNRPVLTGLFNKLLFNFSVFVKEVHYVFVKQRKLYVFGLVAL